MIAQELLKAAILSFQQTHCTIVLCCTGYCKRSFCIHCCERTRVYRIWPYCNGCRNCSFYTGCGFCMPTQKHKQWLDAWRISPGGSACHFLLCRCIRLLPLILSMVSKATETDRRRHSWKSRQSKLSITYQYTYFWDSRLAEIAIKHLCNVIRHFYSA